MPIFSPHNLVGRTFVMDPDHNGNVNCAKIVEAIEGFDNNMEKNPTRIKFKCSINDKIHQLDSIQQSSQLHLLR